jgi:hypothetical protein
MSDGDGLEELFARSLEPLVLELEAVRAELAELKAHRLDVPAWAPGVYRLGAVVQHFHGQYFKAAADTAAEPGDGVAWARLGLHGFRYRGLHVDGADYQPGDLVARDGAMLLQTAGALVHLTLRGRDGARGPRGSDGQVGAPGRPGDTGARGADGAALVKLEAAGGLLFAVMSDGRRDPIALEAVQLEGRGS